MKISSFIIALFILFTVSMGCSKPAKNTTPVVTDSTFMKATIGGTSFNVTGQTLAYATSSSSGGINMLYINGVSAAGKVIQIVLIDNTGIGTIPLATGAGAAYYYSSGGFMGAYSYATGGTVTLTSLTPNIKGTFSFTTTDSTVVADGSFFVKAP